MFSVENLYYILYVNLFKRINVDVEYFWKFGSVDIDGMTRNFLPEQKYMNGRTACFFHDQEPVKFDTLNKILQKKIRPYQKNRIIVTSEHSDVIKKFCKENKFYHLYYFFHGFACLDWYKDVYYFSNRLPNFQNKFLSLNRLCTKDRSYRLFLVSELIKRDLLSKGSVSLQLLEHQKNKVKFEVFDTNCRLSKKTKIQVYKILGKIKANFVIDGEVTGESSAHLGSAEYDLWQSSFLHVVSETVFFDEKLHLTEKIFKPIVSQRPFILLGAYKNLEYLKSYGFRTFDKWIDESYDNEPDNEKRLLMACDEIEKIAILPEKEIETMYWDMQQVIEHNYCHFYTEFKQIIVDELVDNFEGYMRQHNNGRLNDEVYDIDGLNLPEVKKLLAQ